MRKAIWFVCLAVMPSATCLALDPDSLIATKQSSTSVRLTWDDVGLTRYCILRDDTPLVSTSIGSSDLLVYTDDMAVDSPLFYQVDEPITGLCPGECEADADCSATAYCEHPVGACGDPGLCVEVPTSCSPTSDPVCGCDGATYDNACEAALARVSIEHTGACTACTTDADCLSGSYCEHPIGGCADPGVCMPIPPSCSPSTDPVCGCDGSTYDNPCEAARASVSIDHTGSCVAGGCRSNADCAGRQYCHKTVGDCAGVGACMDRPMLCPLVYDPVCGCDGVTYDNDCIAASAGASVDYPGVC